MTTEYTVVCQDASGKQTTVKVSADTDEQACVAALKTLNSWLAVSALPATVEIPKPEPRQAVPTPAPTLEIGRIIEKGTVIDWIAYRAERRDLGAVGNALVAAKERAA